MVQELLKKYKNNAEKLIVVKIDGFFKNKIVKNP